MQDKTQESFSPATKVIGPSDRPESRKTLKSILIVLGLLLAASGFLHLFGTNERPIYGDPHTKTPTTQEASASDGRS